MKLGEIIKGHFFNDYIKSGNIMMLSEGRPGIDQRFSLYEGILRLEVDKATFERMGLDGKAIPSEGRKHIKARYAIELNLRLPSMVRGKKGFERVIWAFDNVLNHTVTWLFCDLKTETKNQGSIAQHQPTMRAVAPETNTIREAIAPDFPADIDDDAFEESTGLLEWLAVASSLSPRIEASDNTDAYLCRYRAPNPSTGTPSSVTRSEDLIRMRWRGFITCDFAIKVMLAALKLSSDRWFAVTATSFGGEAYTILKTGDRIMTWEYAD